MASGALVRPRGLVSRAVGLEQEAETTGIGEGLALIVTAVSFTAKT